MATIHNGSRLVAGKCGFGETEISKVERHKVVISVCVEVKERMLPQNEVQTNGFRSGLLETI